MRTYACTDFHGFLSLYEKIHKFLKPEDKVIFLGDAADRGPHGWECIKAILDDPQWTYLRGNHDDMLLKRFLGPDKLWYASLHNSNGGDLTALRCAADPDHMAYLNKLDKSPVDYLHTRADGTKVYLSHSGAYNPRNYATVEEFVWDRDVIYDDVPSEVDYILHGHTTAKHLARMMRSMDPNAVYKVGEPLFYCDGRRCDLDNCTITSGWCVLMDLDDFDQRYAFSVGEDEADSVWED